MNARLAAVFVVLLAALGGGALLYFQQDHSQRPAESAALGQPLLKGLKAAEVATIRIAEPNAAVTLERRSEGWTVAERDGFPADLDRVRDFVIRAIELKAGQIEAIGDQDRARLNLDASGTRVEFRDGQGKLQASFIAGRKVFKREPENAGKAAGDGRFVLLPEDPRRVIVVANPLTQATARTAEWISRRGLALDRVSSVEYRPAEGEGWKIERTTDNAEWKLAGARAQEKLAITRANAAAYSLSNLEIDDVAPKGLEPGDTGLDRPALVTASTFDHLSYALKIGKAVGEQHYIAVSVAGEPRPEGKDAEERGRKLAERLAREKVLASHVLLVSKSRLEDVQKKRAELLEKPAAKKK